MKKRFKWKKGLAVLLSACMVLGMVPVQTRAAGAATQAGGSAGADTATSGHYDENGFCKGYEIDPNGTGAWVKKTGDEACKDENCNGYQPMTTVTEDGTTWYEISNAGQLYWFASQVDNGKLLDANVRLTADIVDNEGVTFGWDENNDYAVVAKKDGETIDAKMLRMWNPIGTVKDSNMIYFAGHFDGQGHVISGLYFNQGSDFYAGVFRGIYGSDNKYASVEKVGIENSYIYGKSGSGGITGYADYAIFKQCYNATYLVAPIWVGGIVAASDGHIKLSELYNVGEMVIVGSKSKTYIGQIIGDMGINDSTQFSTCYEISDLNIDFCGNGSYYNVENTFLSKESFYNGEVAYLLSQSTGSTWGQNLSSENSLPRPCASDQYPVYKTCTGFTNDASKVHHSVENGLCTTPGCDYYEGEPYYNETDGVYEISNAGQLYDYADKAQTVYTKGARLTADIVVNEGTLIQEDGTPVTDITDIRTWNGLFRVSGSSQALTFDGNNHSISGLYANGSGLQGFVLHNSGTVKNLQIKNSVFISTDGTAGGIAAGDTSYTATFKIQNCSFEGYVEGAKYAGGIAGENAHTSNCYADAYVAGSGAISPIVAHPSITGSAGTITNTAYNTEKYTAECTTSGVKGFTTDQFISGEVAYALNHPDSDTTTDTWKQNIDAEGKVKDITPTLNEKSSTVYRYNSTNCEGNNKEPIVYVYTNDVNKNNTNVNDPHTYATDTENLAQHKCSECGDTEDHTFTYKKADNDNAIIATCSECGATYTVKLTKSAAASDGKIVYDGTAKKAETAIESGNTGIETIPESAITYATGTDAKISDYSTNVPKDAGTYKAKLTLGTGDNAVSIETEFTIEQATPVIAWAEDQTNQSAAYTGDEIDLSKLTAPTVTLVNGETFSDTDSISYSYRELEYGTASGEFRSGLPTDRGAYEIKASIPASGNYTVAEGTMTLEIKWLDLDDVAATLTDQNGKTLNPDMEWWATSVNFTAPEGYTISYSLYGPYSSSFSYLEITDDNGKEVAYYLKNEDGEIGRKTVTVRIVNPENCSHVDEKGTDSEGNETYEPDGFCDRCGTKLQYKISLSSRVEGDDSGTSIAELTGGGLKDIGEEITISAPEKEGFQFEGWYIMNGEFEKELAKELSYTFTPGNDLNIVAVYKANGNVKLSVAGETNAYSVQGTTQTSSSMTKDYKVGTKIVVEYVGDNNAEFLYWQNDSGKIVSRNPKYEFTLVSNTSLTAVTAGNTSGSEDDGYNAFVVFESSYGQIMQAETWNSKNTSQTLPAGPSKLGGTFKHWTIEGDSEEQAATAEIICAWITDKKSARITLIPVYEEDTTTYTVTVNYNTNDSSQNADTYENQKVGNTLTAQAKDIGGKKFAYWSSDEAGENILSYDKSYFIMISGDVTLYANYKEESAEVDAKPVIAVTNVYRNVVDTQNKLSFEVTRSVPEGYELQEQGVIYTSSSIYKDNEASMVIGAEGVRIYTSSDKLNNGVFTLNINVTGKEDTTYYLRGYVIVKDSKTGNLETIYTTMEGAGYNTNNQ